METLPHVRAGCYLRISSDPNDRREGVERQRADTLSLCELKGWQPTEYYCDNDVSASKGNARPEWDRLLSDIKAGRIDAIAAWDQDRGWRMMNELESLRRFFTSLDRTILFATTGQGDIDLYSPTGVLAAQIKTAVSEHEIAMMRVRQRRAAKAKAEAGKPQWRKAFGYVDTPSGPIVDPTQAELVGKAYQDILAGGSISDIAREWNALGQYGLNGKPWSPGTLSLYLRSPRNAGLRAHNDVIVGAGTWEPLVSEDVWRAAQAVLNAPGRVGRRKSIQRHPLTGILLCGKCNDGSRLSGQHQSGQIAYVCKQCRGCSVRSKYAEPVVYGAISGRLARPDAVDLLRANQDDNEALRAERLTLMGRLDEIADAVADGDLTPQQARRATERIQGKLDEIDRAQHDADRARVLDGLRLGHEDVADDVRALSADRFRTVCDLLVRFTALPVGKGSHVFDPRRIAIEWLVD